MSLDAGHMKLAYCLERFVDWLVVGCFSFVIKKYITYPACNPYQEVKDALPYNDYFEYYGPDYRLHIPVSNMENMNTPVYLEK